MQKHSPDWFNHWNSIPAKLDESDYLRQVGKTVGGYPISPERVDALIHDIVSRLQLNGSDSVLDLCCGNGFITFRCAKFCRSIIGVDYSSALIKIARSRFHGENVSYLLADVCALPDSLALHNFTKMYMYEALQHLNPEQVKKMLFALTGPGFSKAKIYIASIPDKGRIWDFYNTSERREEYHRRIAQGTEAIGYWWEQAELQVIAEQCGYQCEFFPQNPVLHTAHYRFDALLQPISISA